MLHKSARRFLFIVIGLLGFQLASAGIARADDKVSAEYRRRFTSLAADDIPGHVKLARWCQQQQAWKLLAHQCRHILGKAPNQKEATLLLDLARAHLSADEQAELDAEEKGSVAGHGADPNGMPRVLTDDEVQMIRRKELHLDEPERVPVRIDRRALNEFFELYTDVMRLDRKAFFRLPRAEQAQLMLRHAPDRFGPQITISSDPKRMDRFVRDVQPIVLAGCATAECHGGSGGGKFRLHGGRSRSDNVAYTNYLILHEAKVGERERPMIDRNSPPQSLLLTYGLPADPTPDGKEYNHSTPIQPIFHDSSDRDYLTVLDWLRSLDFARPDYGIDLSKP